MAGKKPASTAGQKDESSIEDMMKLDNLLDDRIQLANTISVLEDETEDSQYRTSVTEDILPEGNEDLSSGMFTRLCDYVTVRLGRCVFLRQCDQFTDDFSRFLQTRFKKWVWESHSITMCTGFYSHDENCVNMYS